MTKIERQPIDSSAIASAGFDPRTHTLEVEFRNGRVYRYYRVPEDVFRELLAAESKGTFLNLAIKPRYRYRRA